MISLTEIAKRCGVSVITVSRALDPVNSGKVKNSTREKILEVCKKENFYPSFSARALASGKTSSVGFIIPGMKIISSPQTGIYLEVLSDELEKKGYNLLLLPVSGSDWESIRNNAEPLILSNRCDGYITAAFSVSLPKDRSVTVLQTTSSGEIDEDTFPVIGISSSKAMLDMAKHLQKNGYKKPLFINFGSSLLERIKSWENAVAAVNGLAPLQVLDLPETVGLNNGDPAVLSFLEQHSEFIMQFDAWIFNNDAWAMIAGEFLKRKNLSPGKDIALIGFDNIERNYSHPRIATISPPLEQFGREAAKMVLERIKFPEKDFSGIRIELESQAVFRESCCRI